MKPTDVIPLIDDLVATHARRHYITMPEMRRMAAAIIAHAEPPANVPGVTGRQVLSAFCKVREVRNDRLRP